jgi:hypothetical protein
MGMRLPTAGLGGRILRARSLAVWVLLAVIQPLIKQRSASAWAQIPHHAHQNSVLLVRILAMDHSANALLEEQELALAR